MSAPRRRSAALLALALLVFAAAPSRAEDEWIAGRVVYVNDGDTAVVDVGGHSLRVRFYGVDAPERQNRDWPAQPYSRKATEFMRELIGAREVRVRLTGERTHAREVGEIFVADRSASRAIVAAGLAWWNARYAAGDRELARLQAEARSARRGLWRDPDPVPPWVHRGRYRASRR
ncbi:MAG TPA: thermonuclease family protein [Gammaproteobacteria bacterium]|nr:thermonuclease family protein [Gammaproteobacteria bacterium]